MWPDFSSMRALRCFAVLTCLVTPMLLHPAFAQDGNEKRLKELEELLKDKQREKEALEQAFQNATTDAERLSREMVLAGHDIQQAEENVARLEVRITTLEQEVVHKKTALAARQDELLTLISALERLSKRPAALAILQPGEALDTARSASVMGTIVPQISEKAASLKTDIAGLAAIQTNLSAERFSMKNTLERLTVNKQKLAGLIDQRKAEASGASSAATLTSVEIDALSKEATNLRDLMAKLTKLAADKKLAEEKRLAEANKRAAEKTPPKTAATKIPAVPPVPRGTALFKPNSKPMGRMKGQLATPVTGTISEHFGDRHAAGTARGIKFEARAGAQVLSPYDGQIVFAGPFREYGNMLIIEHEGGYHSLLAGMGELYNNIGQWVLSGEPVGLMKASNEKQQLYLEIREKGQPVNPELWLKRQLASSASKP